MPKYILLLVNKETNKILLATYATSLAEATIITRDWESESTYVKTINCDLSIRKNLHRLKNEKPKFIVLYSPIQRPYNMVENCSSASFACSNTELAQLIVECPNAYMVILNCDYTMRKQGE
jgi:hypothetical protein